MNGLLVSVAGLIAGVGNEPSCTPRVRYRWPSAWCCSVAHCCTCCRRRFTWGGPTRSLPRLAALALAAGVCPNSYLPTQPQGLVTLLPVLVVIVVREGAEDATSRRLLTHQQASTA